MDSLRKEFNSLTGKDAPQNLSKSMLEKYISWYGQLKNKQEEKELKQLLKVKNSIINKVRSTLVKEGTRLIREYQGNKYEVSILKDGGFFYKGQKYKSLSKIAREITGTNWNGKLFFGCKK